MKTNSVEQDLIWLRNYFSYCEYELILYMQLKGIWVNTPGHSFPDPPNGFKPGEGSVDYGFCLYWIQNRDLIDTSGLNPAELVLFIGIIDLLSVGLPDSKMTQENYDFFKNGGELIYTDGSVLGMNKWETYDQGWLFAALNLVKSITADHWYGFQGTPDDSIIISGTANTVKIALIGDWGTGDAVSVETMRLLVATNPDYIVHLGDVYYSGSPASVWNPFDDIYFNENEEKDRLINTWPSGFANKGKSFTLNSNHEMYTGAYGYYGDALVTSEPTTSVFNGQNGLSCFNLCYKDWNIVGLDSAYFGSASGLFMKGKIETAQTEWLQRLNLDCDKTIVLTHHDGIEVSRNANQAKLEPTALWSEVNRALGGDPYAWYWGHVHNAMAFKSPLQLPPFRTNTFARCTGNGALPYGNAPELNIPEIPWRATTLQPSGDRLSNGFAMLTIDSVGETVTSVTESFYDLVRAQRPAYTKQIFPRPSDDHSEKASETLATALDELGATFNAHLYHEIETHLGPAMSDRDASLVACSDPSELKTVKDNFVIGKLGVENTPEIDVLINEVCQAVGQSNRHKNRADFYYLLVIHLKKENVFL